MLHLSDIELLDAETTHPHLAECESCRDRMQVLEKARGQLDSFQQHKMPMPDWTFVESQLEDDLNEPKPKLNVFEFFWHKPAALGLAASVLLTVAVMMTTVGTQSQVELPSLAQQNHELQRHFYSLVESKQLNGPLLQLTIHQLQAVDTSIQQAYLKKGSKAEIDQLWLSRMQILETALAHTKQPRVMKI